MKTKKQKTERIYELIGLRYKKNKNQTGRVLKIVKLVNIERDKKKVGERYQNDRHEVERIHTEQRR